MAEGWSSEVRPLDTERLFQTLDEHGVLYVLVGGVAAVLHRWPGTTVDVDVVPGTDTKNLNRLGRALRALNAKVWADPNRADLLSNGKPPEADDFGYTAEGLRREKVWHLTSDAGLIDVAFEIDGVGDHAALVDSAERREVFGVTIAVASLAQIIASKRAVARPKDLRVLPELEGILAEQHRHAAPRSEDAGPKRSGKERKKGR